MIRGRARSTLHWTGAVRLTVLLASLVATGCVERQLIIESNVPNSQVYVDNQPAGTAPSYFRIDYYGYYKVTIVHPGYETLTERVHVMAPWYAYPPFDFVVEALWPFHIHDTRRYYFELHEITKPRVDDLIRDAEALRQRGYNLPIPEHPAVPKTPANPPALPQTGTVVPPVGPQQGPSSTVIGPQTQPIVPPVGPQPVPGGPAPGSTIPSVLPPTQ